MLFSIWYVIYLKCLRLFFILRKGKHLFYELQALDRCELALTHDTLACLSTIDLFLDDNGLKLSHIGQTEWMEKKLLARYCKRMFESLQTCKAHSNGLDLAWASKLKDYVITHSWQLSDIGTSEEKLWQVTRFGHLLLARDHLEKARHAVSRQDDAPDPITQRLNGLLSVHEIVLVPVKFRKGEIRHFADTEIDFMRKHIALGGLDLSEDLGTSEEEIRNILQEFERYCDKRHPKLMNILKRG